MAQKSIHLPSLRGNFGSWNYFSTVIKVKDIVEGNRVITVPESKALYTKNINQILQREIDLSRISKIKEYLLKSKERFFSSLIVAIHKGNPEWADFDLERQFRIDNDLIDDADVDYIENKIGVLTLAGNEEIFVLDGQHRLLGIRKAFEENKSIGDDEISLIIVIHKSDLKERTRRLFTVLNRYAVSIKPAEKVILEEDDAAAILTRKLVQDHPIFILDNAVSSTKMFNLTATDIKNFTTLVCLYEINKILVDYSTLYKSKVIIRPTDEVLKQLYKKITDFWSFFFDTFPNVIKFIKEESVPSKFIRNKKNGGNLLLRPEGQLLFATIYKEFDDLKRIKVFKENVAKIDFDLSSKNWMYVFWKGDKMETGHKKLKKSIFRFLLGKKDEKNYISNELTKIYKEYNLSYKDDLKPIV
ncbi:DNA sulfur modification protein DndB [Candidatus Pollutiaquabacter sp.]|uniref:DNA sulfur modification protein DndB n=1 Tax=Candidatus Pollutiaquabacter sp. TaxID=3416354 RepID=UPI003CAAA6A1|nr:DGQHR domain-containing protein [Bacteroidota bacterium]